MRFEIKNNLNETLVGEIFIRNKNSKKIIIILPGFGSDRNSKSAREIAELLSNHNTIIFDLSGIGESQGDFSKKTLTSWVDDTKVIIDYAKEQGFTTFAGIGTSCGSSILMSTALEITFDTLVLRAPIPDYVTQRVRKYGGEKIIEWEEKGFLEYTSSYGVTYTCGFDFFRDAENHIIYDKAKDIKAKTVVISGELDVEASPDMVKRLVKELPNNTHNVLKGAHHDLKTNNSFDEVNTIVKEWFVEW